MKNNKRLKRMDNILIMTNTTLHRNSISLRKFCLRNRISEKILSDLQDYLVVLLALSSVRSITLQDPTIPEFGILLTGNFNHLKLQRIVAQFRMKKLVRIPTRGNK